MCSIAGGPGQQRPDQSARNSRGLLRGVGNTAISDADALNGGNAESHANANRRTATATYTATGLETQLFLMPMR